MESWFEVEFILLKVLDLQPNVLDGLEFYRAEYLMENLKKWNDKEKENQKTQEDSYKQTMPDMSNPGSMAKNFQKSFSMPSMPKMPGLPKF